MDGDNYFPQNNIPINQANQNAGPSNVPVSQQNTGVGPQLRGSSGSPELPAHVEGGISAPEQLPPETVKSLESGKSSEGGNEVATTKGESLQAEEVPNPDKQPNEQEFESPFKLSGYQASKSVSVDAKKGKGQTNVVGDVSTARTWLLVLLGRIIKMHHHLSVD